LSENKAATAETATAAATAKLSKAQMTPN